MDEIAITLDVDWAPDFIIDAVSESLRAGGTKATWFVTHDSPAIRRLFDHRDSFEIGIHPNFMAGSSQGATYREVLDHLMRIVPRAKSVRTHGMVYSAEISRIFAVEYGIENDSSIFLGQMAGIVPQEVHYGERLLLRMPYYWSDDAEMSIKKKIDFSLSDKGFEDPGLKVLCFHPIHIYLNSADMNNYNELKGKVSVKDCPESTASAFVNQGEGAGTFLRAVIEGYGNRGFRTLSEIGMQWRG
jgi:hypothetical protein